MGKGLHLARIAGIDVVLDPSLLIIFFLITGSLAIGVLPVWHPDWNGWAHWLVAGIAAMLFLVSILVHELSHALVGRAQGFEIRRITLFVFGGMSHLEEEVNAWRSELWMAIVGPLTSVALGIGCIALGNAVADTSLASEDPDVFMSALSPLATILFWLGPVNLMLGIFNLVPGFPLDGGRVLRAVLWGVTGSITRATRWASAGGQFFAWLLVAAGVAMIVGIAVPLFGSGLGGAWLVLIGLFLNFAALTGYRNVLARDLLGDVPVSRLMQRDPMRIEPEMPVSRLVEEYLLKSNRRAYPVVADNGLVGLVCLADVRKRDRRDWGNTSVREIMTRADRVATLRSTDSSYRALSMLGQRNVNQLPVVDDGALVGMVYREDIIRWLSLYGHDALVQSPLGG